MFKGLAGIKKVVKGGFNVVAETSSQLADQVVNDPNTSKDSIKESIKKKVQGGVATVVEAKESSAPARTEAKDKASKVAHDIKHYGAFAEEVLGYSDPTKDLRKAVKQKEKAAKKARKEKKKKTGKKEDLFDPENLAKYKKELEEKRKAAEESAEKGSEGSSPKDESEDVINQADNTPEYRSPYISKANTPKEEKEEWQLFKSLTSGVDSIIQQKKSELEELKVDSYFQKKPTSVERENNQGTQQKKTKKKVWVDLDNDDFDDFDGVLSEEEDVGEEESVKSKDTSDSQKPVDTEQQQPEEVSPKEEKKEDDIGLVEIPEDEPFDPDEEVELFNTDFVEALANVKLAVIPDSPTFEDDDDPFNTDIANEIVKKDQIEKKKVETKQKFAGLGSVADVLSGKAESVDKTLIEHAVRKKRRRANRINLIAETQEEVTAIEDIGVIEIKETSEATEPVLLDEVNKDSLSPGVAVKVLATTPVNEDISSKKESIPQIDVSEFEDITEDTEEHALTSNIAILAGELGTAKEESEDEFDAAFDALAKESVTKTKIEELEKAFENDDDLFDTSAADKILNLASLTDKVHEEPDEIEELANFDDPFDTSAFEEITSGLEEELAFESLASRKPEVIITPSELTVLPLKTSKKKSKSEDPFGKKLESSSNNWTAFQEAPKRPPPPSRPPRPPPSPIFKTVRLDPRNRPSVVVKAPSNDSIKSWNCAVADNLIQKSQQEAQEAALKEESEESEEEFDPFDTTEFDHKVPDSHLEEESEDPFDTSNIGDLVPGEAEIKALGAEGKIDLLGDAEGALTTETLEPQQEEADPFDTDFASKVLPNKGDPFDTSFLESSEPGKAEIQALEEEFIDKPKEEGFDIRAKKEALSLNKVIAPGTAGRTRPHSNLESNLEIKVPDIEDPVSESDELDEVDPFDTSIVDKVIPVRSAAKRSKTLSIEDEEFDPTLTFKAAQQKREEELDPFDTSIAGQVIPELKSPSPPPKPVVEKQESIDSDDFDPRR